MTLLLFGKFCEAIGASGIACVTLYVALMKFAVEARIGHDANSAALENLRVGIEGANLSREKRFSKIEAATFAISTVLAAIGCGAYFVALLLED